MAVRITGTYTDWHWPSAPNGYTSFEWELTPRTDPSPDGYFWSHQFWLRRWRGGLCGPADRRLRAHRQDRDLLHLGRGRRGRARVRARGSTARARATASASPSSGRSARTYELRVVAAGPHGVGGVRGRAPHRPHRGAGAWQGLRDVVDHVDRALRRAGASCADIAHSVARFGVPTADGGAVAPVSDATTTSASRPVARARRSGMRPTASSR